MAKTYYLGTNFFNGQESRLFTKEALVRTINDLLKRINPHLVGGYTTDDINKVMAKAVDLLNLEMHEIELEE